MRTICGPKPDELRQYIPAAFGNRKDTTPIRIWIRNPTERKKRDMMSVGAKVKFEIGADGKVIRHENGKPKVIEVDTLTSLEQTYAHIRGCVEKVDNYIGANGSPIVTADDLIEHGERDIVLEVGNEILEASTLTDDARKNSSGPQPSMTDKVMSDSTAANVLPSGLAGVGIATGISSEALPSP